jgi:hypothetical protein
MAMTAGGWIMTNRLTAVATGVLLTLLLAGSIRVGAGDVTPQGMTLREMIYTAYATEGIDLPGQVVGGPDWIGSERFDIAPPGDLAGGPDAGPRRIAMLRTLLAERFKLKVHSEVAERSRFVLALDTPAFDVRLQFVGPIVRQPTLTAGGAHRPADMITLLHNPLELTLEHRRDHVDVVVVDSAEPPSAN